MNTTNSSSSFDGKFYETIVSPFWSPWVLNNVVLLSVLWSISYSKNSMIKACSTSTSWKNSTCVVLECNLIGFNGNSNWSLVQGCFKLNWRFWCNIRVWFYLYDSLCFVVFACKEASFSNIWIISFSHKWVRFNIFESVIHESSITSMVSPWAINEVLLWEWNKFSRSNEVSSF